MITIAAAARPTRLKRNLLRSLIAAGGIAVGAMLIGAPAAQADHSKVEVFCAGTGGRYIQDSSGVESCCYQQPIDPNGHHCRTYVGGVFSGVYDGQPTANPRPPMPPVNVPVNPPANNRGQ